MPPQDTKMQAAETDGVMFSKKKASETASVSSEEEHQPTIISDANSASIVNKLESLANSYDKALA